MIGAAVVTGGAAGGAVGGAGASTGFILFADAAVGSATASAIHQGYTTGEVRSDVLAGHTLIGIGTAGALGGGARGIGMLRNVRVSNTGAFSPGAAEGGTGFGTLAGKQIRVSNRGLLQVERHLEQFGSHPENAAMLSRLRQALKTGKSVEGADAVFYMHELKEAHLMGAGMPYVKAHELALATYKNSPFAVYHPTVIPKSGWAEGWYNFWGLSCGG
ncbi:MAG: hypothetical protein R3E76_04080 [Planctomycetota bacterium]